MVPSIPRGTHGWEPALITVTPDSSSVSSSLGSRILSSRFIDGGTEVPRERAGPQGHRQGQWWQQDSNSGLCGS